MLFEMRVLGSVELYRGGEGIPLGPAKRRAMFASLVLEANRPVSLRRLAEGLWAGTPPPSAVPNLRNHASALRRSLGGRLVARAGGYVLRVEAGELDVDRFTDLVSQGRAALSAGDPTAAASHLAGALSVWRGAAAEDLRRDTELERRLAALDDQRMAAFEDLVQARLALDMYREVVADLQRHLTYQPLRERAWQQLMLALYRSGDIAAALGAYTDARTILRDRLGLEPGPELTALQQAILQRDPGLPAFPAEVATVAPPARRAEAATVAPPAPRAEAVAVPRQLPPDPVTFVGRTDELAIVGRALRAAADGSSPTVVAVFGDGGVGKSALAVRAAHLHRQEFGDGQVFVDLRGPGGSDGALGWVLRALGVPAGEIPSTQERQAALYRSLLAGRRVLVLVDNAVDAARVRPFVPAEPGSALLVTSRQSLASLDGAVRVELGPLGDAAGLALLGELVGADRLAAEPDSARELVRRCAGLPLTLRIVGARLTSRPAWSLGLLAARLADAYTLLDELTFEDLSLRACLDAGYQPVAGADAVAAHAFRLVGTLPAGEVPLHNLACRLGVPVASARRTLERLVDARLLTSGRPGWYRMNELWRLYAWEMEESRHSPRTNGSGRVGHATSGGATRLGAAMAAAPAPRPRSGRDVQFEFLDELRREKIAGTARE